MESIDIQSEPKAVIMKVMTFGRSKHYYYVPEESQLTEPNEAGLVISFTRVGPALSSSL